MTSTAPRAATRVDTGRLLAVLRARRELLRSRLTEWVAIPSVAGMAEYVDDVRRSAEWLARLCAETGFPEVAVHPTGESSAVIARWPAEDPGAPVVLVYSHHDVRAAKAEEWTVTSPFQPVHREGRLYGRGASDAKAQVLAHLFSVAALREVTGGTPPVSLVLLIEGQEELGSPGLEDLIRDRLDGLRPDAVVFSDTLQWRAGEPAICTSVRGMLPIHLEVHGTEKDVHSGAVSGPAPNAGLVLAELLARLQDADGRILLPGFYDDVPEPTLERRAELAALGYTDEDWLRRTRTRAIRGEEGWSVLERLWERPALEVVGLLTGDPTGMPRAVIPSSASADLSIRTVPGQPIHAVARRMREFVEQHADPELEYVVEISEDSAQEGYRTPPSAALDALDAAVRAVHGVDEAGRMGNAGGGPAELLARLFDAPVVFFGTGLPEDHWHDSDESVDLDVVVRGAAVLARFWCSFADGAA